MRYILDSIEFVAFYEIDYIQYSTLYFMKCVASKPCAEYKFLLGVVMLGENNDSRMNYIQ